MVAAIKLTATANLRKTSVLSPISAYVTCEPNACYLADPVEGGA